MGTIYGLQIGDVGMEHDDRDQRNKALQALASGRCVKIRGKYQAGPIYFDEEIFFRVYERDPEDNHARCAICEQAFPTEDCPKREYPYRDSNEIWQTGTTYICDRCLEGRKQAKADDDNSAGEEK